MESPSLSTATPGGTMISTEPKTARISMCVVPSAMTASRRSSLTSPRIVATRR
jgi:hypothetical protein